MAAAKKKAAAAAGARLRRKRKVEPSASGIGPAEMGSAVAPDDLRALANEIGKDGGAVLATYREPYLGKWVIFAALPIDSVEPTPYQRDLSETHVNRLAGAIERTGLFLDPIVVVRAGPAKYWTPNGLHRRTALGKLGAKAIVALVLPDRKLAFEILALNTEKAHNLREKALEVVRMHRALAGIEDVAEDRYAFQFEEPALITLGLMYERRPRFSGGAYQSVLRKCEAFLSEPLSAALGRREARAQKIEALDDAVNGVIERLTARGIKSPYLRAFVVARINPPRFKKDAAPADFDATFDKMLASAAKFDADKVRTEEIARTGGAPEEPGA